jgi:hypothetical protein
MLSRCSTFSAALHRFQPGGLCAPVTDTRRGMVTTLPSVSTAPVLRSLRIGELAMARICGGLQAASNRLRSRVRGAFRPASGFSIFRPPRPTGPTSRAPVSRSRGGQFQFSSSATPPHPGVVSPYRLDQQRPSRARMCTYICRGRRLGFSSPVQSRRRRTASEP